MDGQASVGRGDIALGQCSGSRSTVPGRLSLAVLFCITSDVAEFERGFVAPLGVAGAPAAVQRALLQVLQNDVQGVVLALRDELGAALCAHMSASAQVCREWCRRGGAHASGA